MSEAKEFVTKGAIIDPKKQVYIERPEDTEISEAMRLGYYVALLGARQTGKTSLLYKLAREFKESKTETPVYVNLSLFSGVKEDDWYNRVARAIIKRLLPKERRDEVEYVKSCANQEQFRNLLWEIADSSNSIDRFVFLLDEVGAVPEEIRDDFFGTIRTIYDERGIEKAFQKYIFVLSGATPPAELMDPESPMSPFNISQDIYMGDFSLEGVRKLGENLRLHGFTIDDSVIEHIYDWTHGHPNLTQEIFSSLVKLEEKTISNELVAQIVQGLLVWGCNNLEHIRRHLDKDENENVRQAFESKFTRSNSLIIKMELIGLIRPDEDGNVVIRNRIYERMLMEKSPLTAKIISDLRIYAPLIAISRIFPDPITIDRIGKEINTLKRKIPDIRGRISSNRKQLSLALEELEQLGVIKKTNKQYTLTEEGKKVLVEI